MNASFVYSLLAHVFVGLLLFVSLPSFQKEQTRLDSVPILVDLKNIEIADKTNLPAKAKKAEFVKPAESVVVKKETPKATSKPVAAEPVKPVQKVAPLKEAAAMEMKTPKVEKVEKTVPKAVPKSKPMPKKTVATSASIKKKPNKEEGLDSLLASVEKMSKSAPKPARTAQKQEDVSDLISGVLGGIEGGTTSAMGTRLTVSQIDFIAATVRKNWSLDAGIEGISDMVIEIRVSLSQGGRVLDVEFLNKNRYNQDASFRSVAESARRAIYICDRMGDESPFRMLAVKYPERYSDWQKLQLRFNPLDGGVS